MRTDENGDPISHLIEGPPADERTTPIDALLSKARAFQDRERVERARARLQDQSDAITAEKLRRSNEIAARFAWQPVASVTIFDRQVCKSCSSVHVQFRGFAVEMKQRASDTRKLVMTARGRPLGEDGKALDQGLPSTTQLLESASPVCIDCYEEPEIAEPAYEFHPDRRADE